MPKEAIRLTALGMLAERPMAYGDLAAAVRDFTSHVAGPNLDLMGTSIQLLSTEGLIAPEDGGGRGSGSIAPETPLAITDAGRAELTDLLLASVRTPFNDLNKLVVALKMRFFGLLDDAGRGQQIDIVTATLENELARLGALRARRAEEAGDADALVRWLDHDIGQIGKSLDWFRRLEANV